MANSTQFQHGTIAPNTFRLLSFPTTNSNEIKCRLTDHPYASPPPYIALSYVWGAEIPPQSIDCTNDSASAYAPLSITASLYSALTSLQGSLELPLWVDAICINQANATEKSEQIPLMKNIYSNARQVLVWLGKGNPEIDMAMEVLGWLAKALRQDGSEPAEIRRVEGGQRTSALSPAQLNALLEAIRENREIRLTAPAFAQRQLPDFHHPIWQALADIFYNTWFSRLWTFAEVLLAKECAVRYGDRIVAWPEFFKIGMALSQTQLLYHPLVQVPAQRQHPDGLPPFSRLRSFMFPLEDGRWFWLHIREGRFKGVLKPVDRIYALLSLASEEVRQAIPVDYSDQAQEHYWNLYKVAAKALMQYFPLQLTLDAVESVSRPAQLPSWCPDFHSPPTAGSYGGHAQAGFGAPKLFREHPTNDNVILVDGTVADSIDEIIRDFQWSWPQQDFSSIYGANGDASKIVAWLDRCWNLVKRTCPDETGARAAYWQVLLGYIPDLQPDDFPAYPSEGLNALKLRLQENMTSTPRDQSALADSDWAKIQPVMAHLGKLWRNKVFFSTAGGRLGYASKSVASGDKICVFFGESHLYVLRDKLQDQYQFVSVAFVRGLMQGEGCRDTNRQTFHIH